MKKATKWAMGIITFAILILVVIWGSMKMVQLEKEQEQAQKKLEEEQKVKEQKEAEKLASEYMVSYAENLQEDMQDVGLLDLKVTYDTCTRDYFDEYWNIWDYGQDEYCVYYVLGASFRLKFCWAPQTTIVIQLTVFTNVKQKMAISNHLSNY